jgi:hypothetical protein
MYKHTNERGDIVIDDAEAVREAQCVRIDGEVLHSNILPLAFSEMPDLDLWDFANQVETVSVDLDAILTPLSLEWGGRLPESAGIRGFQVVLENLSLMLDSTVGAAYAELRRRSERHYLAEHPEVA